MSEILAPSISEPEISENLKFWHSLAPHSSKFGWKNPVWLIMIGSVAAHTAFWLLLPNPIMRNSAVTNSSKISTIPVVTIPPELLLRSTKLSQQLPPLNLNQINLPSLPSSAYNPLSIPQPAYNPPPLLSVAPQTLPRTSNLRTVPNVSNLNSNLALNSRQSNLNFSVGKSNIRPEITITPTTPIIDPSSNLINNSSSNLLNNQNTKPEIINPINPITGYSTKASDLATNNNAKKSSNLNTGSLNSNVAKPDPPKPVAENIVVLRQIASPETPIPSNQREPIDWIPIDPQALVGITGSVTFALVVTPDGRVEQEPIVVESTNPKLEQLARETIKGYYNKFKPVEQGKYRNIRIQYKSP